MRLRLSFVLAAAAPVLPATLPAQAPFEGVVNLRMATAEGISSEPTVHVKGTRSRMDLNMAGQQAYMVMDAEKGTAMVVMPAQRIYMVIDLKAAASQMAPGAHGRPMPDFKIEPTGRKETVAGIECEHYSISSGESVTDACVAKGMGSFMGVGGVPGRGRGPEIPPELRELAVRFKDGGFLLKSESKIGGQTRMTMQVTKVEKKSVDAAMFEPPAGFQDMSGMMQGVPGRRPPGDR